MHFYKSLTNGHPNFRHLYGMVKFILSAVLLVCFGVDAFGQLKLGVIAGVNDAGLSGTNYGKLPDTAKPRFSNAQKLRVGLFTIIKLNKYFSIRPEIAFSSKGASQLQDSSFDQSFMPPGWREKYSADAKLTLNYIEVPILFRFTARLFTIGKNKEERRQHPVSAELFAGPYVAQLVSSRAKGKMIHKVSSVTDPSPRYNYTEEYKLSDKGLKINKLDYGAMLGAGFNVQLASNTWLYAEGRYTLSQTNLNEGYWNRQMYNFNTFKYEKIEPEVKHHNMLTVSLGVVTNINFRRIHPEK